MEAKRTSASTLVRFGRNCPRDGVWVGTSRAGLHLSSHLQRFEGLGNIPVDFMSQQSSSKNRRCPALGQEISNQRCGSERGSGIACPANCPHWPYAITNYDQALNLTRGVLPKILDFFKAEVDRAEMAEVMELANLDPKRITNPDEFFWHLANFGMACFRNAAGQTLADRWRQKGFTGLTNDERVAADGYGRSYVSLVEIQDVAPEGHMWVVNLFHPESGRTLLIDRNLASKADRFTLLFSWFLPLPFYTRISGVSAVQVSRETVETWKADLERSLQEAQRRQPDLTRDEYLASTFYLQIQRMTEIQEEWEAGLLRGLDLCRAIARFKFTVPGSEIDRLLSAKPELQSTEPVAGNGFDKPLQQLSWLRRFESKALENEMAAPLQHADSSGSAGGLATLRIYSDRLVLEAFSRQKYDFARKLLKRWLGNRLMFETESVEDVATMMAEKRAKREQEPSASSEVSSCAVFASGSTSPEARRVPDSSPLPPEPTREALRKFYEDRYRKFPDEAVPMLENATPRAASRQKALRPRLIELLKIHIHGIDQVNRKEGLQLSLDWLLDELGVEELRARR
jgi:hypothetical protein